MKNSSIAFMIILFDSKGNLSPPYKIIETKTAFIRCWHNNDENCDSSKISPSVQTISAQFEKNGKFNGN